MTCISFFISCPFPVVFLVEELGNQVHVTYGGTQALDVATAFRPDLMLVDLLMPDMDGCGLAIRLRRIPAFAQTKIVAVTGQKGQEHKSLAMKAGFDTVLFKSVALRPGHNRDHQGAARLLLSSKAA